MSVLLYRVDDRLIHGQVVLGWGRRLSPRRILVVDDRIAADAWERELLGTAIPAGVTADFLSSAEAARSLAAGTFSAEPTFVLLESPAAALRLTAAGWIIPSLNLGGVHREGGVQVTPYLFLLPEDLGILRELAAQGTEIYAQDLPDARRIPAASFLREAW